MEVSAITPGLEVWWSGCILLVGSVEQRKDCRGKTVSIKEGELIFTGLVKRILRYMNS